MRAQRDAALAALPNLPAPDAPDAGHRAARGRRGGATGRDHLELAGERIDMERGARLSGSRFAYLRGELVLLELALVRYALEKLLGEGFEPVIPPVLVRERALYGTGFLPDTEQQIYRLPDDDLYLVGHLRGRRWPRCTTTRSWRRISCRCATPASRPAFAARPAPPARTPAASSACTSSTRSRCSASWSPRRRPPSTSGCWRSRSRSCRSSRSPTGWWRSRSTTSAPRRPRSTTSRRGCPARAATAS